MNEFLEAAIKIGEDLIEKIDSTPNELPFKNLTTSGKDLIYMKSESMYSGNAGVAFFFLELYRQTQDDRFKNIAFDTLESLWDYTEQNPSNNFAFLTGRIGLAYTLTVAAKVQDKEKWNKRALSLVKNCEEALNNTTIIDDFLNGLAGSIIGLLHIYESTKESWLLEAVNNYTQKLLDRATVVADGPYWDHNERQVKGLCGFSHGAAGLGWTFAELGRVFNHQPFHYLANQAFRYENAQFNNETGNWPDYRNGIFSKDDYDEHLKNFEEENFEFFKRGGNMNAWCHGAMGVGISRWYYAQGTKNETYRDDFEKAVKRNNESESMLNEYKQRTFTLCHGSGGNAELNLLAAEYFNDESYIDNVKAVAQKALSQYEELGYYRCGFPFGTNEEDVSLFMGNAGIGYFFLRLNDPKNSINVLLPALNQKIEGNHFDHLSIESVNRILIGKPFARTLELFNQYAPEVVSEFLSKERKQPVMEFVSLVELNMTRLSKEQQLRITDLVSLEKLKWQILNNIESYSYINIQQQYLKNQQEELLENVSQKVLKLQPAIHLHQAKWSWEVGNTLNNSKEEGDEFFYLLWPSRNGVEEICLQQFTALVVERFQIPRQVSEGVSKIYELFDTESQAEKQQILDLYTDQVKQLVMSNLLVKG